MDQILGMFDYIMKNFFFVYLDWPVGPNPRYVSLQNEKFFSLFIYLGWCVGPYEYVWLQNEKFLSFFSSLGWPVGPSWVCFIT